MLTATTDARVLFEQCVNRLTQKAETVAKAKVLYHYFHKYESQYGELSQVLKLEERMEELFPEDPTLQTFARRYSTDRFDAIATRIIVSPAVQLRPKGDSHVYPEAQTMRETTPAVYHPSLWMSQQQQPQPPPPPQQQPRQQLIDSPKRPLDDDSDYGRPRKVLRGGSPLKGAAGRRMDQQRRIQVAPLELDITFLLGILPPAYQYDFLKFSPQKITELLRSVNLASADKDGDRDRVPGGHGHNRQVSGDYAPVRALSPYESNPIARTAAAAAAASVYRNSPLRTEAYGVGGGVPGGYETAWTPAPGAYGTPPPNLYGTRPSW